MIYSTSSELARSITQGSVPANHIRGVRISLDSLRYESEMTERERRTVQNTIFSSFSAMKDKPGVRKSNSFTSKPSPTKVSPNKSKLSGKPSAAAKSTSETLLSMLKLNFDSYRLVHLFFIHLNVT